MDNTRSGILKQIHLGPCNVHGSISQHQQSTQQVPVRDVLVGLDDADHQVFPFYKGGFIMRYDVCVTLYSAQLLLTKVLFSS